MARKPISQYIVISDEHAGDKFGLCPPGPITLDGGGKYYPSKPQKKMYDIWKNDFWGEWVPTVTRGEPFGVINNGDSMDGRHHNSVSQFSHNLADQSRVAQMLLEPIVDMCDGVFYMVRGTEAHGGQSCEDEERLAEILGAIPDKDGIRSRWELWLQIGKRLAHIKHKISGSGRGNYELSAPNAEYWGELVESVRWNEQFPDWSIRSHRHHHCELKIPTAHGDGIFVVTPGWQLITPFAYTLSGVMNAQIGGILLRAGDEEHYTRHFVKNIARTKRDISYFED